MHHTARALLISAAIAAIVGLAAALTLSPISAGTPTPTASPAMTPTPTSTPYPQSTITIRFTNDAEGTVPVELILESPVSLLLADGVDCTPSYEGGDVRISEFSILWPRNEADLPVECTKGPPTDLRFEFRSTPEGPSLVVETTWIGEDIDIAEWIFLEAAPVSPSPSSSPTPPPTATPSTLPSTGGGATTPTSAGTPTPSASPSATASPTVTPTPSPTATPTPTPYPQTTITIRFVRDGEPVDVIVNSPTHRIIVNGVECQPFLLPGISPMAIQSYSFDWPPFPSETDPSCLADPPVTIEVEFPSPTGAFIVTVQWQGTDLVVDFEPPGHAVSTPTASPGTLPSTGGMPDDGAIPLWLFAPALAFTVLSTITWTLARRH